MEQNNNNLYVNLNNDKELKEFKEFIIKSTIVISIAGFIILLLITNFMFAISFALGNSIASFSMLINGYALKKGLVDGYGKGIVFILSVLRVLIVVIVGFLLAFFNYKYLIFYILGNSMIILTTVLFSLKRK